MLHILKPFDTTKLKRLYCYEEEPYNVDNKEVIEITSEDSLFPGHWHVVSPEG